MVKDNSKELKELKKEENRVKAEEIGIHIPTDEEVAEITGIKPKQTFIAKEAGKGLYIVMNAKTREVVREYAKKDGCADPAKAAEGYAAKLSN